MAPPHLTISTQLSTVILVLVIAPMISVSSNLTEAERNSSATIYEVLESHQLPIGIFPKSISGFSIDPISGRFHFQLANSPCDAKFETQVRYDANVTGIISDGHISNLSGVATQELFLWLPVNAIQVDIPSSGLIYFDAGVVSKQFSLSLFETPRDCSAPAAGDPADDHDNRFSTPLDISFLKSRERIIENPSQMSLKERSKEHESRAAS